MSCKAILSPFIWSFLASCLGFLLPGYAFFTSFPPPLFPKISLITSAVAIAIIIVVIRYKPKQIAKTHGLPLVGIIALVLIFVAIVLIVSYVILWDWCTVLDPRGEQRFQIGFGKCSSGLTDRGLELLDKYPNDTVNDWMMREAAFREHGPEIIWKSKTIRKAGIILIAVYFFAFFFWTTGFALLSKQERKKK